MNHLIRTALTLGMLSPVFLSERAGADVIILRGSGDEPPRMVEGTLTPTGGGNMKLTLADGSVRQVNDRDIVDVRSAAMGEEPPVVDNPTVAPRFDPPIEPPVQPPPPVVTPPQILDITPVPPADTTPSNPPPEIPDVAPPEVTPPEMTPPDIVPVEPVPPPIVESAPPIETMPPVQPPVVEQPVAPPPDVATVDPTVGNLWPLARGAKWVRDNGSLRREIEITGALKDGDRTTYTETTTEISNRSSIVKKREIVVEQRDGQTIYSRMDRGKSIIVLVEPLAVNASWSAGDGYERFVVSTTENFTDSRGIVHANCVKVELRVNGRTVPNATQYFAPGKGLVSDDFVSFTPPVR